MPEEAENITEEMSEEEYAKMRDEVVAEIEAEESGETARVVDAEPELEPAPEGPQDPWANVDPGIKAMYQDLSGKFEQSSEALRQSEYRLKQAESRIGGITNELAKARKAARDATVAPTESQMQQAAESRAKWEELKNDFPEWGEGVQALVAHELAEFQKANRPQQPVAVDVSAVERRVRAGLETEFEKRMELKMLTFAHPKWRDTVKSAEYKTWLSEQPEDVRKMAENGETAAEAAQVLSMYANRSAKKTPEQIAADRKDRLQRSTVQRTQPGPKPKPAGEMTDEEIRLAAWNAD